MHPNLLDETARKVFQKYSTAAVATSPPALRKLNVEVKEARGKQGWYECTVARALNGMLPTSLKARSVDVTLHALACELWQSVEPSLPVSIPASDLDIADGTGLITFRPPFVFSPALRPSTAPFTFDPTRLNDPGHIHWQRVGIGLKIVTAALAHLVDAGASRFHDRLLLKMEGEGKAKYSGKRSLYEPAAAADGDGDGDGSGSGDSGEKKAETGQEPSLLVLKPWVDEILLHHREKEGRRKVHWFNSDARKWCHPGGHWQVMKLFCSPLGKHSANVAEKDRASRMDSASLLSMLLLCDEFEDHCSDTSVHGARGVRNPWAHDAAMSFTQTDAYGHLDSLCK